MLFHIQKNELVRLMFWFERLQNEQPLTREDEQLYQKIKQRFENELYNEKNVDDTLK